jgi:hypothetical protein
MKWQTSICLCLQNSLASCHQHHNTARSTPRSCKLHILCNILTRCPQQSYVHFRNSNRPLHHTGPSAEGPSPPPGRPPPPGLTCFPRLVLPHTTTAAQAQCSHAGMSSCARQWCLRASHLLQPSIEYTISQPCRTPLTVVAISMQHQARLAYNFTGKLLWLPTPQA